MPNNAKQMKLLFAAGGATADARCVLRKRDEWKRQISCRDAERRAVGTRGVAAGEAREFSKDPAASADVPAE